ncbi:LysR family transcriptional regulator [Gilliamella sp. Pas-s95]|uniref:LysR family transcriptional regulator n=1 Tax=Gilliamella sp. Pas-s95 TaxID=2687317 RepID=UPI0013246178|nr:LysR family transcriptional regulator [Gilliamella sp. Pas-s95]MWN05398.1 LysR family transcriptional regulator [Gilliamella sp. Pas-s95]
MDIRHLQYFVAIVKADFNLSLAAKRLYISQPALSQFIKQFEDSEKVDLFERYKGRLQGLTPTGELFYEQVKQLLLQYNSMLTAIREDAGQLKGKVRIGIPPLILGAVFSDIIADLIINHPNIEVEIIEKGAYELGRMFMVDELDFAILLDPTNINPSIIDEHLIQQSELSVFFHREHPLAEKEKLTWLDLNDQMLAIFEPSFMIHHKLMKKFSEYNIQPQKCTMSASWDFLLLLATNSKFLTILPSPILDIYSNHNIVERRFVDPIDWKVLLCHPKKDRYSKLHQYVFNYMLSYFKNKN